MGIGEQAWLGEIDENAFHNIDDPNSERRDKVFFKLYRASLLFSFSGSSSQRPIAKLICEQLIPQNTFVGLTNLGATCYVNTFLQVWFHNLELRRSLYLCQNPRAQDHNIQLGNVIC